MLECFLGASQHSCLGDPFSTRLQQRALVRALCNVTPVTLLFIAGESYGLERRALGRYVGRGTQLRHEHLPVLFWEFQLKGGPSPPLVASVVSFLHYHWKTSPPNLSRMGQVRSSPEAKKHPLPKVKPSCRYGDWAVRLGADAMAQPRGSGSAMARICLWASSNNAHSEPLSLVFRACSCPRHADRQHQNLIAVHLYCNNVS